MPSLADNNQLMITPLAVGRGGVAEKKSEGDGITPVGNFAIVMVLYRADKVAPPTTALPCRAITRHDIWVDDPDAPDYNKLLQANNYEKSHEKLWRDDDVYDLLAVLDYNMNPIVAGKGSAIFIHLARPDNNGGFTNTEGCLALRKEDFYHLVATATTTSRLQIKTDKILLIP